MCKLSNETGNAAFDFASHGVRDLEERQVSMLYVFSMNLNSLDSFSIVLSEFFPWKRLL